MPPFLAKNRNTLAPIFAAILMVVLVFTLRVPPLYGLLVGLLGWLGFWLVMAPDRRKEKELVGKLGKSQAQQFEVDLTEAEENKRTLMDLNKRIPDSGITRQLHTIVADVDFLIAESRRRPQEFRADRKVLVHYLPQVVELAQLFADQQRFGQIDFETRDRTTTALADLTKLFDSYKDRRQSREAMDLNVQIDVLEAKLREEGIQPTKKRDSMFPSRK